MPYIHVKTNTSINKVRAEQIKSMLGLSITAIPGKSEGWLMTEISGGCPLYFKGTDEPAAMVQVSLYGQASSNALDTLTSHITGILTNVCAIPSDRIYVSYMMTEEWGWNGSNF